MLGRDGILCEQVKPVCINCLVALHLAQEGVVVGLSGLIAIVGTFVAHHRHVLRKNVVQIREVLTKLHTLLRVHQLDVFVGIVWPAGDGGLV